MLHSTCNSPRETLQVQKLKEQEAEDGISSRPRRPKALILGPTRELTDQILRVAKSISHHAKFRSTCVNGGVDALLVLIVQGCIMQKLCRSLYSQCSLISRSSNKPQLLRAAREHKHAED